MPGFDINRFLKEDITIKDLNVPFRFGKGFDVKYSLSNGTWIKIDSGSVWLMKVTSPGAYSINFIFNELSLPEGSELYIYSFDGSMVYGPITSNQNLEEKSLFLTDIIKGESVILYLYVPEKREGDTRLSISRIVHGYKDLYAGLFESGGKDVSGTCERDVACYPSWGNESDAVAQVLLASADALCSGALLNNTAQNFKAYFLTAFHCIDRSPRDGTISSAEKSDAQNWMFKFHYKKTSCNGSQVMTAINYNHDNYKAAWNLSDFALVELLNTPLCDMCLSFLGWDKTGVTPTKGTSIHHPSGDVMKISFDYDQLVQTDLGQNSGVGFWRVMWDTGAMEDKSSGASLFDQNKRVIGQLTGGHSACDNSDMRDWFGCFYRSWGGPGNQGIPDSSLVTWLGSGYSTLNTIRYNGAITGPDLVCNSNSTFTLQNAPPGSTVTWTAGFVTPSSGTGTTATFKSTCILGAVGTVTFTISNSCISIGQIQVSKTYLSAGPDPNDVKLDVYKSTGQHANKIGVIWVLCPNSTYYIYVNNNSSCSTSQYTWVLPPSLTKNYTYNNMISVNTNSNPGGNIFVYAQTCCSNCGSNVRILSDYVGKDPNCGYSSMTFIPNPAADETILELKTDEIENYSVGDKWEAEVYNQQSQLMLKTSILEDNKYTISTSSWKEGIYYVRVKINGKLLFGKFIVAR